MALFGLGLNPLTDVAKIGQGIGGVFGNAGPGTAATTNVLLGTNLPTGSNPPQATPGNGTGTYSVGGAPQTGSGAMFGDNNGAGAYAPASAPAGPSPLFTSAVNNVLSSANLAGQTSALTQQTGINDYIQSVKNQQGDIDNQAVQNYLAKQQGNQGILDWVGQGIRSGGVMLANKNASNSSAADALAKAYSTLGRQQAAGVNGQFANAQNQVAVTQKKLQDDIAQHINDLPAWKTETVNNIVTDAQKQLGQIDQTMAYMSLPDRVDMEAQKQAITSNVLAQLQGLDQALQKAQGVQAAPSDQLAAQANTLFQAGTAPAAPFNFSTNAPAAFQNTGPAASDLPLFTFPGSTKNQNQPAFG